MNFLKTNLILCAVLCASFIFFACEKEDDNNNNGGNQTDPPTAQQAQRAMQEYALVNKLFSDAADEAGHAAVKAQNDVENKTNSKSYPIIQISPFDLETFPKTITVDYGEENFLCEDDRYRRGIIIIETTGWYREEGTVITINFDEYYQNDHKLEGTQIITNEGRNNIGNLVYSVDIENGKVTTPEGSIILYTENTSREWIEGEHTIDYCYDVYLIDGNQDGTSSDGLNYTLTIRNRLDVQVCCKWVRAGILDVDIEGIPTISIDYGIGECNNTAVVTILGAEYPIVME